MDETPSRREIARRNLQLAHDKAKKERELKNSPVSGLETLTTVPYQPLLPPPPSRLIPVEVIQDNEDELGPPQIPYTPQKKSSTQDSEKRGEVILPKDATISSYFWDSIPEFSIMDGCKWCASKLVPIFLVALLAAAKGYLMRKAQSMDGISPYHQMQPQVPQPQPQPEKKIDYHQNNNKILFDESLYFA